MGGTQRADSLAVRPKLRGRILVVMEDARTREALLGSVRLRSFEGVGAASLAEAAWLLSNTPVDVAIADMGLTRRGGVDVFRRLRASSPGTPVVMLTSVEDVPSAVACLRDGASDFVLKPPDAHSVDTALRRALETRTLRREVSYQRARNAEVAPPDGQSPVWKRVMSALHAAAASDRPVVLCGEAGTGKATLARRVHDHSARAAGPFVRVSASAIGADAWERALFGQRSGVFAGVTEDAEGHVHFAQGGTLVIEEITALPTAARPRLRRLMEEGTFQRPGEARPATADVRLVLTSAASETHFGRDAERIDVPPLRARKDDIPLLTEAFAREAAARLGRPVPAYDGETLARLHAYDWPGNLRELRRVIEHSVAAGAAPAPENIPALPADLAAPAAAVDEIDLNLRASLHRTERSLLVQALRRSSGVPREAARLLGIDPRNLRYFLRKYGLSEREY